MSTEKNETSESGWVLLQPEGAQGIAIPAHKITELLDEALIVRENYAYDHKSLSRYTVTGEPVSMKFFTHDTMCAIRARSRMIEDDE